MSKMIKFITVDEAAKILGVTRTKAYDLGYKDKIGRYVNKHGGVGVRYNRAEVLEFKADHGVITSKPKAKKAKKKRKNVRPGLAKLNKNNQPNIPYPETGNPVLDKQLGGSSHVGTITPVKTKKACVVTMVTPNGCKIIGDLDNVAAFYNHIK